ncbi:hypothetical protein EDD16DRAFT_1525979 [Pisolithus croceorrhizus]|nr:hypothetical protein EDD16DRAFT_1525979 [Pisolithus croceorrhizus]KAI6114701.1 hypothetical protein EV401DRAFT_1889914 [Pisolithus croceorrhizus]KAI6159207.1 hypothetical protein EDD17DRAFT_1511511 [Pisolithus thermaeus]
MSSFPMEYGNSVPSRWLAVTSYDDDRTYIWSTVSEEVIKIFDDGGAINDVRKYFLVELLSWLDPRTTSGRFLSYGKGEASTYEPYHGSPPSAVIYDIIGRHIGTTSSEDRRQFFAAKLGAQNSRNELDSAQENDQVSLELVCSVRDKRPLVVGGRQRGVRISDEAVAWQYLDFGIYLSAYNRKRRCAGIRW